MDRFIVISRPTTTELRDKKCIFKYPNIDETENDTSAYVINREFKDNDVEDIVDG